MVINYLKNTVYLATAVLFLGMTLLASGGLVFFYYFKAEQLEKQSVAEQQAFIQSVADGLEGYLRVTRQLSHSITELVAPLRGEKQLVEKILRRMLASAPAELIYGIGAWYEPQVFAPDAPLFGPYAHRGINPEAPLLVSYEWCSADYDFPTQPWYLAGKQAHGKTVFTTPYFDTDMVYMTASRAFFDSDGNFAGVTSVDMVLPLIQQFILKYNDQPGRTVYLTTAAGKLLAHPYSAELLQYAQAKQPLSLLDLSLDDLQDFIIAKNLPKTAISHADIADVGWLVHVSNEQKQLQQNLQNLRQDLYWLAALAWGLFAVSLLFLIQGHRTRTRNQALREALQQQQQREILLQEMNKTLEQQVALRTTDLAAANREICALNERLKEENLRMSAELDITRQMQQMVLPRPEELAAFKQLDLDIAAYMEPASEVGGDYYDVLQVDDRLIIGIGDVTGHGLESGVIMLMVQMAVRTLLANQVSDPVLFLHALNQALYANIQRMGTDKNLTLALLEYRQHRLRICGQHEEILVIRRDGSLERIDTLDLGFMIGMIDNIDKFVGCCEIQLDSGDGIVLYTDGITEAHSPDNQLYGIARLSEVVSRNWLAQSAQQVVQRVVEDVKAFTGGREIADDMTLVVLKRSA